MTGRRMNWERANEKPARVLSWKEQRLDRAADNWIAGKSLTSRPKPELPKKEKTGRNQ